MSEWNDYDSVHPATRDQQSIAQSKIEKQQLELESTTAAERPPASYDRGDGTRRVCIIGITLAWILGVFLVALGAYLFSSPDRLQQDLTLSFSNSTPQYVGELLPLIFNLIITLINETLGFTHTTSLRWALQAENRLEFNSNLRLLSSSRRSKPNKWYLNVVFVICLVLSYSTSSQLLQHQNDPSVSGSSLSGYPQRFFINPVAITALGVALLGQAAIASWAFSATAIPTWSSSPIDTLKAAQAAGSLQHMPGRCMRSVDQKNEPSIPALPRPRQCSAWSAHSEVRWVFFFLCALLPLGALWVGICYSIFNSPSNQDLQGDAFGSFTNWALLPSDDEHTASGSPFISLTWDWGGYSVAVVSLLFFSALQTIITLALHCVELLVNLSRDEAIWRRATTTSGLKVSIYNSIRAAATAWQTIILFVFKALIHWMFGLVITITSDGVGDGVLLRPIQMIYLMILVAVLAAVAMYISARRPSGPQPATFGHLQTMANLIDEWAPVMFWGDKSTFGEYHAGTSGTGLGDVSLNCLYS